MSLFKSKNSTFSLDPFTSVNCDIEASISGRVKFHTQNIQFEKDTNSNLIAFIGRSYENGFNDSKKGMMLIFSSDIQSGTYLPQDPNFPFDSFYYYENGANADFTTSYQYKPESGTIKVEVVSNNTEALCYLINFDFKGKDNRTEELHIVGKAELNVFMRTS
ncbi:hypothetical protein [Pseudomonas fluorescens]|uniref:Uncharacterized protein n=1 Tax=Pseudomonas fluorescens TaxID=294 RepID=A0A5E7L9N9_PSEFL|nr:hypothetical protein [Pseudomonas fluorescens]VVP04784.1 hypothetical protein PS880_03006 [Pseudomonas fluorescens]